MKATIQTLVVIFLSLQLRAQVSFKLSSSPVVGTGPTSVAVTDVNGDGKADLICANYYSSTLSLLTNNGSGGFVLATNLGVGTYPFVVIATNVTGGSKVDLVCLNSGDSSVSVFTNNGSGRFVPSSTNQVGIAPTGLTAADVNGDGKVDLITANWNSGSGNTLTILTNNGSGGFVLASSPVVGTGPTSVTAADVNGDGKMDLITANWVLGSGNTLTVMTNSGNGGFVLASSPVVGSGPYGVTAADVNGDGKVDLISANRGSGSGNTLTVMTNSGNGGFVLASSPVVGIWPMGVTAADVNGDGKVDLISSIFNGNALSVMTNNGSGGFVLATNLSVGSNPNPVLATDINGDGKVDLISPNGGGSTLSVFTNATPFPAAPTPVATGQATLQNGFVTAVNIINGGYGYTNVPLVRLIGGGGSGALAFAVVSNGVVISVTVTNAGFGYTSAPLVVIDPPFTLQPVFSGIATMSSLYFSNLTVGSTNQLQQFSTWYWTNQPINFIATNASYTQMVAGVWGSGDFRLARSPVSAQAFATPQVVSGFVVGATLTSNGSGYLTPPAVTIVGDFGANATAVSQIAGGTVTNIVMTAAGSGYTGVVQVRIDPPPAVAEYPVVQPVMRLDLANLSPYNGNYQIQFASAINGTWANTDGGFFTVTTATNSQFIAITNGTGFFRLQHAP